MYDIIIETWYDIEKYNDRKFIHSLLTFIFSSNLPVAQVKAD